MDAISEQKLNAVHPALKAKIEQLYDVVQKSGIEFRITQGLRTWEEQAAIYAKGRTDHTPPDQIVSDAPPGHSWHEFGLAVDFVPMVNGSPVWDEKHPWWTNIRDAGESIGLASGSRWKKPDFPHFQLTGLFPVSPTDQARTMYENGGIAAVWNATGLDRLV